MSGEDRPQPDVTPWYAVEDENGCILFARRKGDMVTLHITCPDGRYASVTIPWMSLTRLIDKIEWA